MRRAVRFVVALVTAHGLVAWLGSAIVPGPARLAFPVYRWAVRMLMDAARLRSRDRLTGRPTDHLAAAGASR